MADNKKSVILYVDTIGVVEKLTDEEAGRLFKHYLRYVNDLNPIAPDRLTEMIFEPIKQQLKRDLVKWIEIGEKRSETGRAGGIKSGEARRSKTKQKKAIASNLKENEPNASKTKQNEHVTVTVIDNVIVNGKDRLTVFDEKQKLFYSLLTPFVEKYGKEMMRKFYEYWVEPNKSKTKLRWEMEKTWDLPLRLKRWASNQKEFNKPQEPIAFVMETEIRNKG